MSVATLLALYGDDSVELMGYMQKYLLPDDYNIIKNGQFSLAQLNYLTKKYPELMGFWALIAKAAAGVAKGIGQTISSAIAKRKQRQSNERIEIAKNQQAIAMQSRIAANKQKSIMTVALIGIPVVGIAAYFFLKK